MGGARARACVCVYESGSSSHQYPPALVEKNRQARSKLTEIPSDMRMKGEKKKKLKCLPTLR